MHILETIIEKSNSWINTIIKKVNDHNIQKNGKALSKYDKQCLRLDMVYKMATSINKYTLPTDKLKSFTANLDCGNVTINAIIIRDEREYTLTTDVIYAGGWNKQRFHTRYTTQTTLPQTNRQDVTDKYEALSKAVKRQNNRTKKLNDVITLAKSSINRNLEYLATKKNIKTVTQILEHKNVSWLLDDFESIDKSCHNYKLYKNDIEGYKKYQKECIKDCVNSYKKHIKWATDSVKAHKKLLKDSKTELSSILKNNSKMKI